MTTIFMVGVVFGAVLSLRFNVFILIPGVCLGGLVAAVSGIARGDDLWHVAVAGMLAVVAMQVGYFAASVARGVRHSASRRGHSVPSGLSHPV